MKTVSVPQKDLFNDSFGGGLKLRKGQDYQLSAGDRVNTACGTFIVEGGSIDYWDLRQTAPSTSLAIEDSPITVENFGERSKTMSAVDRIETARALGII
jgi:hypothetical protein